MFYIIIMFSTHLHAHFTYFIYPIDPITYEIYLLVGTKN